MGSKRQENDPVFITSIAMNRLPSTMQADA